ncbi:hypothetical protein LCGC14_0504030 [marine sediment metagenome]|uniref:Uncharacterized protein n=1 Tax=marine sediment metagenome TaxID=412755 RepID=A0A0F9VBL7_9ZZZZ
MGGYWSGVGKEIGGFFNDLPLIGAFIPDQEWPLPERPSLGLESRKLQDQHAKAIAQYTNRMMQNNIGMVNRNFASLNRGDSGQRNQAIQETVANTTFAGANAVGQGSLGILNALINAQLGREQMDETRMFRQAQINAGGGGAMDDLEQILQYYLLAQGLPSGGGSGGGAALTRTYAGLKS